MIQILYAIIPSFTVGIMLAIYNNQQKKREAKREEAERIRQKSEKIKLDLLLATAKLSYAVAMAIKRGKPNGEVEEGIKVYEEALENLKEFEREQLSKI